MLDDLSKSWGIDDETRRMLDSRPMKDHLNKFPDSRAYLASCITSRVMPEDVLDIHRDAYEQTLREVGE